MIEGANICFSAGGSAILSNVGVRIEAGEITAILGPNGAGKSTLMKCLSGSLKPDAGTITLQGSPLEQFSLESLARRRAVLSQSVFADFSFSALEVAQMGRNPYRGDKNPQNDLEVVCAVMKELDLWHLKNRIFPALSGGEMQRVHLSRVLAQIWGNKCVCLLLDEPTSALDLKHRHGALRLIHRMAKEKGAAVGIVMHDLPLAMRYADKAVLMKNGKVFDSGRIENILSPANVSAVFEVPYQLVFSHGRQMPDAL